MSAVPFRTARRAALAVTVTAAATLLAACSSAGSAGSAGTASSSSAGASSSPVAAKVAEAEKVGSSYPVPTAAIEDVSSLRGKTVYYIPITQQAAQFTTTAGTLKTALSHVGVTLQTCNGNATPAAIAACVTQATKAKASAIVTDAIPYLLAANAFDAAQAAGIPVLNTDQLADSAHPAADRLGFIYAPTSAMLVSVADWIIADSAGKATVVINETTDNPASLAYVAAAQKEFKAECSGCTVVINQISSASFNLIPSSTSSALLKTPNVGYVISEYDQYLQPTQAGVQQAGKTASVKALSGATALSGMQMIANKNFLYAGAGQAIGYQGWADADAAVRMMLGTKGTALPTYTIPYRLFDRDTVSDVTLTSAAESSGEWFGPTDFTDGYLKLWGVS